MINKFRNQANLLNEKSLQEKTIVIIGAGAIGSFFAMTLAKMGAEKITVYDHDTIEEHNFANQMYPWAMLEQPKVEALANVVRSYGDCEITQIKDKWTPDNAVAGDIIVSAVDNMDIRKSIYEFYRSASHGCFFIDGRMSAMVFKVYGVDMSQEEQRKYYEASLYPQSEAATERCGEKSIIYTVLGVTSHMLDQIKKYIMKEHRPTELVYDFYNNVTTKKYHMTHTPEIVDATELIEA